MLKLILYQALTTTTFQVDFDPSEHFTTKSTYRAALYLDGKGAKIPIPARFRSGAGMVFSLSDGNFRRCQNEAFELLPFPTEFLMEFCTSSGNETSNGIDVEPREVNSRA